MQRITCGNCQAWEERAGHCRKNPPVIVINEKGNVQSAFPRTERDGWCLGAVAMPENNDVAEIDAKFDDL
jgi:hypothetical protein